MVCGLILSFPLLQSCLVDVPALLQEEHGSQSIDSQGKACSSAQAWGLLQTTSGNRVSSKAKPEGPLGAETVC